jgi:hypothetical protein
MNLYDATVPVFTKFLRQIDAWLDKAAQYGEARKFAPEVLFHARLAPDQYSFARQVQAACDQAKFTVAKLTGKEPPAHPDTEQTLGEIRARVKSVVDYLATFQREDFAGAEERPCGHSWMQGKKMRGGDYLDHFALPNFHFHLTIAYAILRHNGVPLVKADFTGEPPFIK